MRARRGQLRAWLRRALCPLPVAALAATAAAVAPAFAGAAPPARVVSMNVCTDQLAMLLAAPGQLQSVSHLAVDAGSSAMVTEASAYPLNHGLAEEIFLMKPDLVLTSVYSARATVSMLRRLGFRVEEFEPEASFDDIRGNIRKMGAALHRAERADELIEELDARLERLKHGAPAGGGLVASYDANSYTAGSGSLSDTVIRAAGLENLGSRIGVVGTGLLPLETLVMARPDIMVDGAPRYDGEALARQNFAHPAYRAALAASTQSSFPASWWVCGGPFTLAAAEMLQDAARQAPPR